MIKSLRKWFVAVVVVLSVCLLAAFAITVPFTHTSSTIDGVTEMGTTSGVNVGGGVDLWDTANGQFNETVLTDLGAKLFGDRDPVAYVKSAKDTQTDSYVVPASTINKNIPGGENTGGLLIKLGGQIWMASSMTLMEGSEDVVLTLYLANASSVGNKQYYSNNTNTKGNNMYSRSLIRDHLLTDSTWSFFSKGSFATQYLVQPKNIKYQRYQTWKGRDGSWQYHFPNEALYDKDVNGNAFTWYSGINYVSSDTYDGKRYDAWGNDYIWLPSASETGWNDHANTDCIWKLSSAQRAHTGASYSWLRSGIFNNYGNSYIVRSSGTYGNGAVTNTYGVRPALHLNLTSAGLSTARDPVKKPTASVKSKEYTGSSVEFTLSNTSSKWTEDVTVTTTNGLSLQGSDAAGWKFVATNAGTYSATLTLKPYRKWEDGTTAAITLNFEITKKKIARPTAGTTSLVFNNSSQTYTPTGYNSSTMTISGTQTAKDVCTNTVTVTPKSNYQWSDGTNVTSGITFTWSITRAPLTKPTGGTTTIPYTGAQVTYTPAGYLTGGQMTITGNTGTNPGEYTATVTPTSNYQWSDGTTTGIALSWRIGTPITKPTAGTNSFVYDGNTKTYTPAGFDPATMDIITNTATVAGNYSATITPKMGYCWNDNSIGSFSLTWTITRALIERPTLGTNTFVYNTQSQSYSPAGFNSSTMTLGGTTSATDAATYIATVTPTSNYQWNDGVDTEAAMSFTWSITPKPLAKPTLSQSELVYDNGNTLTVPTLGFDSSTMEISGNTGVEAGKKTAVITLKNTQNYKWADDSIDAVSLDWEILKRIIKKPTESVQKTFIFDGTEKTYTPNGIVADRMVLSDNKATEVGTYYAKVNLKPNYQWEGETEEELSFRFMVVPPGLVVKEGVDYDFLWTDSGTWDQRYTYGDTYQHKMNDQDLNQVAGDNVFVLGKVQPNTTIAKFLDNLDSDRDYIKIFDNFGTLVFDGTVGDTASTIQYIGTSYKIELYVAGENGLEILDEVYVSILGDINADGIVNAADLAMMRRLLNGDINLYSLRLERVLAVYLDNKGGLTAVDQELLNGLVAGRLTSDDLFEEQELLGDEDSYKYIDLVDGRRVEVQESANSVILGNVAANTSIKQFADKAAVFFSVGGASNITIYNNQGELVYNGTEGIQAGFNQDKEYVGTGWKVKASNSETEYIVSVLGDVTGDGIINAMDVTYLRRIANDNKLLAELEAEGNKAVMLAATISNRGGICTADSEILWGTICGTMDLNKYI